LVKRATLLGLALCAVAWLASAATTTTTKKKTVKRRSHTVSAQAKTTAKKTVNTTASKTPPKTRAAPSKTAKGKKTARRAPAHARQLAPTKDRYQQIQQALASKGYFSGEPNGVWGSDSTEALKRFQTDQNLTPDGKLTSLSLIALGLGPKRLSAQSAAQPTHPDPQQ
jgi:peptidoglycan hydrolase-like protein with peptidoglycan-binding domain